ncbi:hypothetical protein CLAIMM_08566 [Cladophialophora immunda]|nr:hypothetical protein CLAIMM_08566 [Cladophialophora immunda]
METAASAPAPMQPPDTHDYNPLAIAMESNPRFAMFKRFGSLAVLNLIQLQKELEKRKCIIEGKNSSEEKNQALEDSRSLLVEYWVYSLLWLYRPELIEYRPIAHPGGKGVRIVVQDDFTDQIKRRTAWVYGLAASVVAALVPSLTILWLYNAQRTMTRIWITMGLTTLIGVVLRVVTKAHVSEIFGITAAFAAVEVVFIGSANGNSTAA